MSVEASEGKIQHQPIYSFTHSPARSGLSAAREELLLALLCHSKETLSVYRDTWAFKFRGSGSIRVKQARRRGKHYSAADFSSLPIWIEPGFFTPSQGVNDSVQSAKLVHQERKNSQQKERKKKTFIPPWKWLISVTDASFKIPSQEITSETSRKTIPPKMGLWRAKVIPLQRQPPENVSHSQLIEKIK